MSRLSFSSLNSRRRSKRIASKSHNDSQDEQDTQDYDSLQQNQVSLDKHVESSSNEASDDDDNKGESQISEEDDVHLDNDQKTDSDDEQQKEKQSSKVKKKKHQPFQNVRLDSLDEIMEKEKQTIKKIQQRTFQRHIKHDEPQSYLFKRYAGKSNKIQSLINFTEKEFLDIYISFEMKAINERKRGPLPSIPWLDALFLQFLFYSCKNDIDMLGALVDVKGPTLRKSIERTRPILHDTLFERWWKERMRPKPLEGTSYEHVALLVDSTSIEVFRPKGHFREAVHYFDGKNGIYALKKEIAVTASPPHYALFSQPAQVGSTHDYVMFKDNHFSYISYLHKTLSEKTLLVNDENEKKWAIIADMGYIGKATDTPLIRKITPQKGKNISYIEKVHKKQLNKIRAPIECFFGRMQKLWKITRTVYNLHHKYFDQDMDICVMLTNEHIQNCNLDDEDSRFYFALEDQRRVERETKAAKRKIQLKEYQDKKKKRHCSVLYDEFSF